MSTILTVDDSRGMRKMIGIAIRELPSVRYLEAGDGREAMEILQRESIDLITLDLNMPEMDGFDLARAIRGDASLCHIPIIMTSTQFDAPLRDSLRKEGVTHYLEKPFHPNELRGLVRQLLPLTITEPV